MSLLSSDRLQVAVHERGINVLHVRRNHWPRPSVRVISQQQLDVNAAAPADGDAPADALQPWRRSLALLTAVGKTTGVKHMDLVLSNHFVRYALLPWDRIVACNGETKALASAHFFMAFGEAASRWQVTAESPRFRSSCLAAAIDGELLAAAHEMAAAGGLQITGVRPYLLTALKRWRVTLQNDSAKSKGAGWFAVFEPGRLTVLGRAGGDSASLYNIRLHAPEALLPTLNQCIAIDRLKSALDGPVRLFAPGWSGSAAELTPFLRLDGREESGEMSNGMPVMNDDFGQAMALSGSL